MKTIKTVEKVNEITIGGELYKIILPYGKNLTVGNKAHLIDFVKTCTNIKDIEYWAFNNITISLKKVEK